MSGQALVTSVNDMLSRDSSAELAAQKTKVTNDSTVRKDMHEHVAELMGKARELQAKAEEAMASAKGRKWTENLVGLGAKDSEKAAQFSHDATMIQAKAQEAQVKAKEAADSASEGIDKIKSTLDALEQAKNDIENLQAQHDRVSKHALGVDE
jgi:hypothetical protein